MDYFREDEQLSVTNIIRYQKIKTEHSKQKSRLKRDVLNYFIRRRSAAIISKKIGHKWKCTMYLPDTGVTVVGSPDRLIFYFLWNR